MSSSFFDGFNVNRARAITNARWVVKSISLEGDFCLDLGA
jgi:hypothetical protein